MRYRIILPFAAIISFFTGMLIYSVAKLVDVFWGGNIGRIGVAVPMVICFLVTAISLYVYIRMRRAEDEDKRKEDE